MGYARSLQTFMEKTIPEPNTGCWLWLGSSKGKYGHFAPGGGAKYAHRAAWELFRGPITDELRVLHHCDTPMCVNPDHLFL